jgi:hypothetical protein
MTYRDTPKVQLRSACKCGSILGHVQPKKQQLVVRCARCNAYAFCCPHADLVTIAVRRRWPISPTCSKRRDQS